MTILMAPMKISNDRNLAVHVALQNTYHQCFLAGWDYGIRNQFSLESFANDDNVTVPGDRIVHDEREGLIRRPALKHILKIDKP
jgi:hypothetical protein